MPKNVFISYARKDGADVSERLYDALCSQDIEAWRDVKDLNPYEDFSGEIEEAIQRATHVVICVTQDVCRADSFVRREIAFALEEGKPILPLVFDNARRPITIINHSYIDFSHWDTGFMALLERLKHDEIEEVEPQNRRERELAYLQVIGQRYDHWRELYTDLSANAQIEAPKVRIKSGAAARHLEMQHQIFKDIEHTFEEDAEAITVESFADLSKGILNYRRVALIGDPGAGKTTTLERLAYELATAAADSEAEPLPLFARLGGYTGGNFSQFLEAAFGAFRLNDYLPSRVFLLLDGLNEMPADYFSRLDSWLRQHPETPVIVSCRKLDYVTFKLPLQRIDIAPLDVSRIYQFIGNYLEAEDQDRLFWSLAGSKTKAAWEWMLNNWRPRTFEEFWYGDFDKVRTWELEKAHINAVRDALRTENKLPGMLGVVSNPFLLFIVIQLYSRRGEPPGNRAQLFDRFTSLLMAQRGRLAAISRPPWIEEELQRQALSALAYQMQLEHTGTSVNPAWVVRVLRNALPNEDIEQLLYLAASASLIERGKTIRFSHQLLQEYFAAYQLNEAIRNGVSASQYWPSERWWEQTGWEETAILLAGLGGDATHVVRWLRPVNPLLAYRCITESGATCDDAEVEALYEPAPNVRSTPLAKADWGRILAEKGDLRPGVGLRPDGLPDIIWCKVPEGDFIYQEDQHLSLPTFYIAKYPITFAQFQSFMDAPDGFEDVKWWKAIGLSKPVPKEAEWPLANHPRESVSWYMATIFCRWLSDKLKIDIRLPSTQEWEKAARGTDGRLFPWGNDYIPGYANINEASIVDPVGPYYMRRTTAVGIYPDGASPYGVMDMAGNVWEWTATPANNETSKNGNSNSRRFVQGGSWHNVRSNVKTSVRYSFGPGTRDMRVGFRVVCAKDL